MRQTVLLGVLLFVRTFSSAQVKQNADTTLSEGVVADWNLTNAVALHSIYQSNTQVSKQLPDNKIQMPRMLMRKNNELYFDWTPGQHARYLMEEIRQGLHSLQVYGNPNIGDVMALTPARAVWPKLRDISCKDAPDTQYYDLDGMAAYCPK